MQKKKVNPVVWLTMPPMKKKKAAKAAVKESQKKFVADLASLGDVWINDAFGTAHRAHASTALIAKYFPNR